MVFSISFSSLFVSFLVHGFAYSRVLLNFFPFFCAVFDVFIVPKSYEIYFWSIHNHLVGDFVNSPTSRSLETQKPSSGRSPLTLHRRKGFFSSEHERI
jgi:hypothetical protein